MPHVIGISPEGETVKKVVTKRTKCLDLLNVPLISIDLKGIAEKAPNIEVIYFCPQYSMEGVDFSPLSELKNLSHIYYLFTDKFDFSIFEGMNINSFKVGVTKSIDFTHLHQTRIKDLGLWLLNPIETPFVTMKAAENIPDITIEHYPENHFLDFEGIPTTIKRLAISEDVQFHNTDFLKNTNLESLSVYSSSAITALPKSLKTLTVWGKKQKFNFDLLLGINLETFCIDVGEHSSSEIKLENLSETLRYINLVNCPQDLNLENIPNGVAPTELYLNAKGPSDATCAPLKIPRRLVQNIETLELKRFYLGSFDSDIFADTKLKIARFPDCDWDHIFADSFWLLPSLNNINFECTKKVIVSPELIEKPRSCRSPGMKRYDGCFDSY